MTNDRKFRASLARACRLGLVASSLLIGCNGEDGGGDGGSSETEGPFSDPDPAGMTCNEPGQGGWEIRCGVSGVNANYGGQLLLSEAGPAPLAPLWLDGVFPGEMECCGGCPPAQTVREHCHASCKEQLCEVLKAHHEATASAGPFCDKPKFNMEGCLSSDAFAQPRRLELSGLNCVTTDVVSVNAICGADGDVESDPSLDEFGCFEFLGGGDAPPTCFLPEESEAGRAVVGGLTTDAASADAGSFASVKWTFGVGNGYSRTEDVDVDLAYADVECGTDHCFALSQFEASIPTSSVEGLTIENAHLYLHKASDVVLGRRGDFRFEAGDVEAVLSADVNGVRVAVVGASTGAAVGHVSPSTGVLYLRDLEFEYASGSFEAKLTLSVEGAYTSRRPIADIGLVSAPESCSDPVAFVAASRDYDGDSLTHHWEVTSGGKSAEGELFEVELAEGEHRIVLRSSDGTSRHGYTSLNFRRRCQP